MSASSASGSGAGEAASAGDASETGIEVHAAMLRAEVRDLDAMLDGLFARLSSVPGLEVHAVRRQGRLRRLVGDLPYVNDPRRRGDRLKELTVRTGEHCFWLQAREGSISCGIADSASENQTGGAQLDFAAWAAALMDEITRRSLLNLQSLAALRQLVEQGT